LNLIGSKFDKYKVLGGPLSQKRDISLYGCKFEKWQNESIGMTLVAKMRSWPICLQV